MVDSTETSILALAGWSCDPCRQNQNGRHLGTFYLKLVDGDENSI